MPTNEFEIHLKLSINLFCVLKHKSQRKFVWCEPCPSQLPFIHFTTTDVALKLRLSLSRRLPKSPPLLLTQKKSNELKGQNDYDLQSILRWPEVLFKTAGHLLT
uniref:Uncharacterized protein n=1 Tax=Romanomermis culicivorax TaxID=13658 RepID=A0A915KLW9_ROMCU